MFYYECLDIKTIASLVNLTNQTMLEEQAKTEEKLQPYLMSYSPILLILLEELDIKNSSEYYTLYNTQVFLSKFD